MNFFSRRAALFLCVAFFLGFSSAGPLSAEVTCLRTGEHIGLDEGYPVRAELASVPHGRVTGREVVRYFIRLDSQCLLSQEVESVDAMAARLYNELMVGSGVCRPPSIGRPAQILFGTVPETQAIDTRALRRRWVNLPKPALWTLPIPLSSRLVTGRSSVLGGYAIELEDPRRRRGGKNDPFADRTTKLRGGWATLPLGESIEITEGQDLVLGLEIIQEPWECPMLVAGPFEDPGPRRGSFFQLVQYEIQQADGTKIWRMLDCDDDGIGDANQGHAFSVSDARARAVCGLRFHHDAFQWNLRAVAQLAEPLIPPED